MMRQILDQIPQEWDNDKFERDHNCIAYAENGKLIVVSDKEIDDLEKKVKANVDLFKEKKELKKSLYQRLGITEDEAKLLFS